MNDDPSPRLTARAIRELLSIFGALGIGPVVDADDIKTVSFSRTNVPQVEPQSLADDDEFIGELIGGLVRDAGITREEIAPDSPLTRGVRNMIRKVEEHRRG